MGFSKYAVLAAVAHATSHGNDTSSTNTTAAPQEEVKETVKVTVPVTLDLGVSASDFNNPTAGSAAAAVKKALCGNTATPRGDLTTAFCNTLVAADADLFASGSDCFAATSSACSAETARRLVEVRELQSTNIKIGAEHSTEVVARGSKSAADLASEAVTASTAGSFAATLATATTTEIQTSAASGALSTEFAAASLTMANFFNATALTVAVDTPTAEVVQTGTSTSGAVVYSGIAAVVMSAAAMLF